MSKKLKFIIVGCVSLVLLAALLIFVMTIPEETEDIFEDKEIKYLFNEPADSFWTKATITNSYGTYTIEHTSADDKVDDYSIVENEGTDQLYSELYSLGVTTTQIATYYEVEAQDIPLADFGLDEPQMIADIEFNTGNRYVINVGDISADGLYYYVMVDGDETIYAVQITSLYFATLPDYVYVNSQILEAFSFEDSSTTPIVTKYNVINPPDVDYDIHLESIPLEVLEQNTSAQSPVWMTSPIESLVSIEGAQNNIYDLFGLTANRIVATNPTDDELEEAGIDEDSLKVELAYNTSEYELIVGDPIDHNIDGDDETVIYDSYHLYVPQNNTLYSVAAEDLPFVDITAREMIFTIAVIPYIGHIETINLELDGVEYSFSMTHEEVDGTTESQVFYNGEELDMDNFRSYLQLLLSTPIDDIYLGEEKTDEPVMKIEYNYNNGNKSDTVELIENTLLRSVISVNGKQLYVGRSLYIDKLREETENLLAGEEVTVEW